MKKILIFLGITTVLVVVLLEVQKPKAVIETRPVFPQVPKQVMNVPSPGLVSARRQKVDPGLQNQSLTEEQVKSIMEKKNRTLKHVHATVFLKSKIKDTYVGQTMALELINHGYGIQYVAPIYSQAYRLHMLQEHLNQRGEESFAQTQVIYKELKEKEVKEIVGGIGPFEPLGDPELVDRLISMVPTEPPHQGPSINPEATPEDKWLSDKDVLKYIQEHPAAQPKQN